MYQIILLEQLTDEHERGRVPFATIFHGHGAHHLGIVIYTFPLNQTVPKLIDKVQNTVIFFLKIWNRNKWFYSEDRSENCKSFTMPVLLAVLLGKIDGKI